MPRARTAGFVLLLAAAGAAVAIPPASNFAARSSDSRAGLAAPDYSAIIRAYRESIPRLLEEKKIPGLAVAVVTDSEILWWEGFGWTDDDKEIPVTPETLFSIQSMSKNFTAAAVLAAVGEGLVDLDAPITRYLPNFTVQSRFEDHPERRMTLRLLLSHRAGFTHEAPDGSNFDLGTGSFENHVRSISRTWLRFPVGQRYCYSNLGVDLAGYILQVRSGRPFAEYVRRKILVPVGMVSSTFDRERIKGDGKRAIGHNPKRDPIPVEIPMVPSGGLYAGAADLARWVQFQLNRGRVSGKTVLPKAFLDEMAVLPGRNPRQTNGYGLGLAVVAHAGTTLLTHGGGGFGFLTYMGWIPEFKIGVVCLTNATGHNFQSSLPLEILDKFLAAGAGAKAVAAAAGPTSAPLPHEVDVLASEQERLAGRYLYASGGVMILEFENGRVGIKSGSSFIPARFVSPDVAGLESDGAPFFYSFLRNPDGSPAGLVRMVDGENLDFNEGPHDPRGPDLQEWEKYVGRYAYRIFGRPGGFFTVSKKNGYLHLDHMKLAEYRPGLFFAAHGEALDFTGLVPTWRNIRLEKTAGTL